MRVRSLAAAAAFVTLAAATLVAGCGFQLRGAYTLPYESIYLALPDYSEVGAGLKRNIHASGGTRLTERPEDAEAIFQPTGEARERLILSLSGTGRVRELRLRYRFGYRVVDAKGRNLIPPGEVEMTRDMTYDDSNILSKQQEEVLLWRDMQSDMVQQLLRRLAAVKPVAATETD
ncbi:LPS-assembly lipoprotein LptE [Rhodocyclus tenuis]|uniref:LPS-assembly lipoprotein LptE n=1 Tax=Rhodocyclus tenuis TaxID=1066 RepID=A0A840G5X6_RHOTE|nr:LPS assembly lipoprotein LptE [Rhodocyclus tenuis]MBB4247306.1 LPS-assembly lipoprotein [Rhodocyclus tenuis]